MYHHNKITSLVLSHHRLSQQSNPASIHSPLSHQVRLEYLVVYRIYSALLNNPDNNLWIFEPDYSCDGHRIMSVVHADSIIRAAHLLPVFKDKTPIPREIDFTNTLDVFKAFYLNKYIDYHAFETLT